MKAVILAAGMGTRLEPVTKDIPKCMVPVGGVPLIDRMIERIAAAGIDELVVVTGHLHEVLETHLQESTIELARKAVLVYNERYHDWGNFYSLLVAEEAIGGDSFVKLDGDVLLDADVLPRLLAAPGPGVLTLDCGQQLAEEEMKARLEGDRIVALNKRMDPATALGESIGVERIDAELAPTVFAELRVMIERGETDEYYERAYERLMEREMRFGYADITGCTWTEVDDAADLARANELVA